MTVVKHVVNHENRTIKIFFASINKSIFFPYRHVLPALIDAVIEVLDREEAFQLITLTFTRAGMNTVENVDEIRRRVCYLKEELEKRGWRAELPPNIDCTSNEKVK